MFYILVQGVTANVFTVQECAELIQYLEGGELYVVAAPYCDHTIDAL